MSDLWESVRGIDPPVGEGGRDWYPYQLRSEVRAVIAHLDDPVPELAGSLRTEPDPRWREVALFGLASQDDPRVDDILIGALGDVTLRPRALYLLGVIGTRGWPKRDRDTGKLLAAIRPWLTDLTPYRDLFLGEELITADLAVAASARIAGLPTEETGGFVGMELPHFTDEQRSTLTAEIQKH